MTQDKVAKKLYEPFLAGDLQAIYALLDPRVEWELVGPMEPTADNAVGLRLSLRFIAPHFGGG